MAWATAAYIVSTLVSIGTTVYGQQQQAKTTKRAAVYNQQVAQNEARTREFEAAENIRRQRINDRRERAAIRAALADAGTETTSGTPLAILGDLAATQDLRINDLWRRAVNDAASLRSQGAMGLWEAKQSAAAADIASAGTALSGLAKAGSGYAGAVQDGSLPDTFGLYPTRTKRNI